MSVFAALKSKTPCDTYFGNVCTGFGAGATCMLCGFDRMEHPAEVERIRNLFTPTRREPTMGMSKIKVLGPGRVKAIHQLNSDGTAYAEDVTIESDVPGRLSYLESQDGKVGVFSFGFSPSEGVEGLVFPEDD